MFITSLGNWIALESTPRSQAVRILLNQPITTHVVPERYNKTVQSYRDLFPRANQCNHINHSWPKPNPLKNCKPCLPLLESTLTRGQKTSSRTASLKNYHLQEGSNWLKRIPLNRTVLCFTFSYKEWSSSFKDCHSIIV